MLELTAIFAYVAALGISMAIPGPAITVLVARCVRDGAVAGFAMLFGIVLGDLIYLSFAVFGLSVLAQNFSILFVLVKWAAVIYLCFLAWVFWNTKHQQIDFSETLRPQTLFSSILSGILVTLGNPKAIAFYLALLPVVINLEAVDVLIWAKVLVPLTIVVLLTVGAVYIFAAMGVRHLLRNARAQKLLHRSAASIMIVAAGAMIARQS